MFSSKIDKYKVYSYHADHTRHLNLESLAKFLQETAGEHAEELGVGFTSFKQKNIAWVLYKQVVKMKHWPKWGDEITIKTWPSMVEKLMCYREFEIYDSQQKLIGQVSTSWIVINLETRRPVRTSMYYDLPATKIDEVNFPDKIKAKMNFESNVETIRKYKVLLQDIDVNNHVNNTSYIDWVFNYYDPQFIGNHQLLEAELLFQKEALYKDDVTIETSKPTDHIHEHSIKRDDQELMKIRLSWK